MIRTDWSYALVRTRACSDAVMWAREQPSYEVAWESCERGDWLLWLAGRRCTPGDAAHTSVEVLRTLNLLIRAGVLPAEEADYYTVLASGGGRR